MYIYHWCFSSITRELAVQVCNVLVGWLQYEGGYGIHVNCNGILLLCNHVHIQYYWIVYAYYIPLVFQHCPLRVCSADLQCTGWFPTGRKRGKEDVKVTSSIYKLTLLQTRKRSHTHYKENTNVVKVYSWNM